MVRKIGKFSHRKNCRFCGGKNLVKFLDLGLMPHAGNFLFKEEVGKEKYYPLIIYKCLKCGLVQILDIVPSSVLFKNYHYLSSVSLSDHFNKYAREISKRFLNKDSFVVEIGSNDGVLLEPLTKMGIKVLGVDPSSNIAKIANDKGLNTIVDYFNLKTAKNILKKHGRADAILANNVLAHIDDMNEVFNGIKLLLNPTGVLIFEVHYLPDLIKKNQYDFFYNEHLSYYDVSTLSKFLNKHNLKIFDIKKTKIHAGSIRIYAKFKNNKTLVVNKRVNEFTARENKKLNIKNFIEEVEDHKRKLIKIILNLKNSGNKIVGYGASGRGNTLLNYCGIDINQIDYIVDESSERQGKFTPGTHIPIVAPEVFKKDKVDYVLLLAWNYKSEIFKKEFKFIKNGGKFIVPFPRIIKI